ncbi:hypothetical protein Tco_0856003, partial [Tanacetum coccineum]
MLQPRSINMGMLHPTPKMSQLRVLRALHLRYPLDEAAIVAMSTIKNHCIDINEENCGLNTGVNIVEPGPIQASNEKQHQCDNVSYGSRQHINCASKETCTRSCDPFKHTISILKERVSYTGLLPSVAGISRVASQFSAYEQFNYYTTDVILQILPRFGDSRPLLARRPKFSKLAERSGSGESQVEPIKEQEKAVEVAMSTEAK